MMYNQPTSWTNTKTIWVGPSGNDANSGLTEALAKRTFTGTDTGLPGGTAIGVNSLLNTNASWLFTVNILPGAYNAASGETDGFTINIGTGSKLVMQLVDPGGATATDHAVLTFDMADPTISGFNFARSGKNNQSFYVKGASSSARIKIDMNDDADTECFAVNTNGEFIADWVECLQGLQGMSVIHSEGAGINRDLECWISNCLFHDCAQDGFDHADSSVGACNVFMWNCESYDNGTQNSDGFSFHCMNTGSSFIYLANCSSHGNTCGFTFNNVKNAILTACDSYDNAKTGSNRKYNYYQIGSGVHFIDCTSDWTTGNSLTSDLAFLADDAVDTIPLTSRFTGCSFSAKGSGLITCANQGLASDANYQAVFEQCTIDGTNMTAFLATIGTAPYYDFRFRGCLISNFADANITAVTLANPPAGEHIQSFNNCTFINCDNVFNFDVAGDYMEILNCVVQATTTALVAAGTYPTNYSGDVLDYNAWIGTTSGTNTNDVTGSTLADIGIRAGSYIPIYGGACQGTGTPRSQARMAMNGQYMDAAAPDIGAYAFPATDYGQYSPRRLGV